MERSTVGLLLKFGRREHVERMLFEGELYCQTLEYFRTLERDGNRGDPLEGTEYAYQPDTITLTVEIAGQKTVFGRESLAKPVLLRPESYSSLNVFCTYGVQPDTVYVDPRNLDFGEACLVVRDVREFLGRCEKGARAHGRELKRSLVRYVDEEWHDGFIGPFRKYRQYEYQSEFRILLTAGSGKPYCLRIGALTDIATIVRSKDINRTIRLESNLLPPAK